MRYLLEYSYKFRIYPNKEQQSQIEQTFGCCRYVYNHYLTVRREAYEKDKITVNYYDCCKYLTNHKKENDWLFLVSNAALQQSLKDLDSAYKNFFRGIKQKKKVGYPKYKSKKDNRQSYRVTNVNNAIRIYDNKINLPKLKLVKCRVSKKVEGRILNATILINLAGLYDFVLCFTVVEIMSFQKTGEDVGIDFGIKDLAVCSNEIRYPNHKFYNKSEKKIAKLNRQLSRKSRGSNNRNKARIKLAKAYQKIADQRKDTIHKMTTELVKNYDVICIEDLNVSGMVRNHKLAKHINDGSFYEIRRQLEYKTKWYGKELVVIDRFYPSSQTCHCCGAKYEGTKDLSVRKWTCPECGTEHDRDINSAINILNEGLRLLDR